MEILTLAHIAQAVLIATAYTFAVSCLVKSKSYSGLHWMLVVLIYMLGIITSAQLISNIVIVFACCILIAKTHGFLKGINYAVTIFAVFQWIMALLGSVAFLLMYYGGFYIPFVWVLSGLLVIVTLMLKLGKQYLFKDTSNKVLLIDITAKVFFVGFFNAFLPRFFPALGVHLYSILALVLLVAAVMIAVCIEYIVKLERIRGVEHGQLRHILVWADSTITKYMGVEMPQFSHLTQIQNPVVKALLYEFIDMADKKGLTVQIFIEHCVADVKLDIYDLFTVVSAFLADTLAEAVPCAGNVIKIHVNGRGGFFFSIKTGAGESDIQGDKLADETMLKTLLQNNRKCKITMNISKIQKCISVVSSI